MTSRRASTALPAASAAHEQAGLYIPDLCGVRNLLLLIATTELLALLFALIRGNASQWLDWDYLGLVSLFAHWIVLSCAGLVCQLRGRLIQRSISQVTLFILLLVQAITLGFSLLASYLGSPYVSGSFPNPAWLGRNALIALVVSLIVLRYYYLQYQWRQQRQAEMQARLGALQARIQPHFLFNSMNTIASLIASDPDRAEDAVLDLSELFRASLRTHNPLITLEEELHFCQRYLAIDALRLGKRMQVEWRVADGLALQAIPPLSIQPLLENAIYHGIQPLPAGGRLRLEIHREGQWIYLLLSNPLPAPGPPRHIGNQVALENIRHRLDGLFEGRAVIKTSQSDDRFTVTLRLPWQPLRPARLDTHSLDTTGT